MGPAVRQDNGDVEDVHGLPGHQRTFGGDGFRVVAGLYVVIEQVLWFVSVRVWVKADPDTHIVPVRGTHLQTSCPPLCPVIGPSVAHDIRESVASCPMAGPGSLISLHRVGFGEIIP